MVYQCDRFTVFSDMFESHESHLDSFADVASLESEANPSWPWITSWPWRPDHLSVIDVRPGKGLDQALNTQTYPCESCLLFGFLSAIIPNTTERSAWSKSDSTKVFVVFVSKPSFEDTYGLVRFLQYSRWDSTGSMICSSIHCWKLVSLSAFKLASVGPKVDWIRNWALGREIIFHKMLQMTIEWRKRQTTLASSVRLRSRQVQTQMVQLWMLKCLLVLW